MNREIYFDNSATTPLRLEVTDAVCLALRETFGNPSSLHRRGIQAEHAVAAARKTVAFHLQAAPEEVCFTSGGTESNNQAIKGIAMAHQNRGRQIIASAVEHPSVLKTCQRLAGEGFRVDILPVDRRGVVDLMALESLLGDDTLLVSLMHVNNENGAVQPVAEAGALLARRKKKIYFHVDAVQSFGKLPVQPGRWGADLLSISGHKIHGPKGVGALYIRKGTRLLPLMDGGGQEKERRSGTENVPGIVGLARAAELSCRDLSGQAAELAEIKSALAAAIAERIEGCQMNSNFDAAGAPHILNVSFPGLKSEVLLHYLERDGVYVSAGSACSAKSTKPSHVLAAMGLSDSEIDGALRFSFSAMNQMDEVLPAADCLARAVKELRRLQGGK